MKLALQALQTFVIGAVILAALTILPAWSLAYWQAWVFIVVFLVSVSIVGLYLSLKDPQLLERRKQFGPAKEQSPLQKAVISLSLVSLLALFVISALAHRYNWSQVPLWIALAGDVLVAAGLLVDLWVFRENSYGASNIRTEQNQQVISSGPYALVRHPMYVGVLIMVAGTPLALGSWLGLLILLVALPALVVRILDEEKLLMTELPGYREYTQKVRYRLIPGLW